MKRRIGGINEIKSTDHSLDKELARNTEQLRRISRFLRIVSMWNRTLVLATETLVRSIARDTERENVKLKVRKSLYELRVRYDSLTPRERQVMTFVVKGLLNKQTAAQL